MLYIMSVKFMLPRPSHGVGASVVLLIQKSCVFYIQYFTKYNYYQESALRIHVSVQVLGD